MIREATLDDTLPMLSLLEKFYEETETEKVLGAPWNEAEMFRWARWAIRNPDWHSIVWDDDGRIKGMMVSELGYFLHMPTIPMGFELIWYIMPEYKNGVIAKGMVKDFEKWCAERGAKTVSIGSAKTKRGDRTERIFDKLGYMKGITLHLKTLKENGNGKRR